MGFISDTFLGGAEREASRQLVGAGRRGQDFIREGTTGARGELETGFGGAEDAITQALQQALGVQGTGLQDIIASLTGGAEQAIGTLQGGQQQGIEALLSGLTGAEQRLDPFAQGGVRAFEQQQALSGALGPEAQQAAISAFQASPGQDFLRSQGEESIARQASATGGLGGGALLADLQQFGTGLAQQDFQNQFSRLGQIAGQGQQAAGQLAQGALGTGTNIADLIRSISGGVAGQQSGLGQQLAQAFGTSATNISNLFTGQGQQLSGLRQGLGTNLANLLTGQATNLSNLEQGIGAAQAEGTIGSAGAIRGTLGDLFSLGQGAGGTGGFDPAQLATAFGFSDRRLKEDIKQIGQHGLLKVYEWTWKLGGGKSLGFMSDEVVEICPEAVVKHESGFDVVNYTLAATAATA